MSLNNIDVKQVKEYKKEIQEDPKRSEIHRTDRRRLAL